MQMMNCPNCRKPTAFKRSLGFGTFFTVVLAFGIWLLAVPLSPMPSDAQTIAQTPVDKPIHDAFEATNIIPVSCEVEDGMVGADVCRFFINALYVKLGKHITVQAFDDPGEDAARKGVLGAFGASGKISFFMSQRLGTYVVLRLVETGSPDATRLYVGGTAYDPSGPTIRQQSAMQAMQNLCASEGGTGPACDAVKQEESKVSQQPNHQLPVWSAKEGIGRDTGPTEAEKAAAASQLAGDFAAYWYKVLKTASQGLTDSHPRPPLQLIPGAIPGVNCGIGTDKSCCCADDSAVSPTATSSPKSRPAPAVDGSGGNPSERQTAKPAAGDGNVSDSETKTEALTGVYSGRVHNTSAGLWAAFGTTIQEQQGNALSGCMVVHRPLYGSGQLSGESRMSQVTFSVRSSVGVIRFTGTRAGNSITGTYVVQQNGRAEYGEFELHRQGSLPTDFDAQNCPDDSVVR
jgi:hypothetical protein